MAVPSCFTNIISNEDTVHSILKDFTVTVRAPEKFISIQKKLGDSLTRNTKQVFDFVSNQAKEHKFPSCPLDKLLTDGFDEEQIWQEIELHNGPSLKHLLQNISNVVARKQKLTFVEPRQVRDEESTLDEEEAEEGGREDESESVEERLHDGGSSDEDNDSDTNFNIEDLEERTSKPNKNTFRPTIVTPSVLDDKFFKLSEMERFLEEEDTKEERKRRLEEEGGGENEDESSDEEDEEFDYFDDLPSSDEENDEDDDEIILSQQLPSTKPSSSRELQYADYFPDPEQVEDGKEKRVHFEDEMEKGPEEDIGDTNEEENEQGEDDDDDLMEDAQLRNFLAMKAAEESDSEGEDAEDILGRTKTEETSSFEKRQERLKERIQQLEESNMSQKPWQMVGEVAGRKRPENSLLEERLDFEVASKPAPVITEETTESIESLIKQRIIDQAWDDVERKIKPKEEAFEFKKRVTLDQEKSKLSLGEIYEQEYLKKTQDKTGEEEEDPAHQEIKKMMDSLFIKLDALSNYHYAPKPAIPELKIVTNVPAISMEEVQPISVADATLLAPEEVKEKSRLELKGDTEKSKTDRKRERRKKKIIQKLKAKNQEKKESIADKTKSGEMQSKKAALEKLEKASKNPSSKTSIIKDDKTTDRKLLTSSKAFFSKLQEEAVAEVKGHQKRKPEKQTILSSKKLKL